MALTGNYMPFYTIIEKVYRDAGYQSVDWVEAIEYIGDVIALIGAKDAYKTVTTNGLNNNPSLIQIEDYRGSLPTGYITNISARKAEIDSEGKIGRYDPMLYSTDIFFQSPIEKIISDVPAGTYDRNDNTLVYTITLSGSSGTMTISEAGNLTKTVTFDTDLETTANNFVTTNYAAYQAANIILTNPTGTDNIVMTSSIGGQIFLAPCLTNLTGNLFGTVQRSYNTDPIIVEGTAMNWPNDFAYTYRTNASYIETNFKEGYVELTYGGFMIDDSGFPMIPDDQKYREAVTAFLIERIDYKLWRKNLIARDVYMQSRQDRDWYIGAARNKANIPSLDKMESMKNMFLRSVQKIDYHSHGSKFANIQERRRF